MKKILFLSFAALCFAVTTHAQDADTASHARHGGRGMMMQRDNEKMAKELNLTDDQKTQFKAIDDAQKAKTDSLRKSGASRDDQRQGFMDAMKESSDKKRAILTPDQQTKYDELMKKRQERMKAFMQRRNSGDGNQ